MPLIVWVYLHSLAVVASKKYEVAQNSVKIWTYNSSRSSEVIDYGTNRKHICDFLLLINSNCVVLSCTISEIRRLIFWKLRIFPTPLLFGAPLPMFPLEFRGEVNREETRVMWLHCGVSCMILTSTVFDW